jgi:hypothetical protein
VILLLGVSTLLNVAMTKIHALRTVGVSRATNASTKKRNVYEERAAISLMDFASSFCAAMTMLALSTHGTLH